MSYTAPPNGFRTFILLWASQSVSVFGSAMTLFAINIWIVQVVYPLPAQQPQLAWALAAVGLSMGIATILTTPVAGALADRFDRKRLMFLMDLLNGTIMALTAYLVGTEQLQVWMVLVVAGLFGSTSAIHGAALDTSYAMLVSDEQLPRANGMMQTIWALSSVLSPAAAASIIALPALARQGLIGGALGSLLDGLRDGVALAVGVNAVSFLLSALVLSTLSIPSPRRFETAPKGAKPTSLLGDIRFGVEYVRRRPPLLWLLATFAVVNLCLPLGVFLPLVVKIDLAADWTARGMTYETALATVNTTMAVGGLVGGTLVSIWGGAKRKRVVVLLLAMLVGGVAQVGLGLLPTLYLAAAAAFLLSFSGPMANAHSQAIWQAQVSREIQGRVFAVRRVMAQGLGPLGQVLAGWLAGRMAPGLGLALLGGVITVMVLGQFFNPYVMRVEDKAYVDGLAGETGTGG